MRSKGKIVLWPVYFDAAISWAEGRRVSKAMAIRTPKTEDIVRAAVAAGLKAELQPNMAHPRYPFNRTGYVLVEAKEPKEKVIKQVATKLQRSA